MKWSIMKAQLLIPLMMFAYTTSTISQSEGEKAFPCQYGEEYKRLDFWLGEWDVYVKGKKTASSNISKSKGGCTLHEDYRTQSEYYGRSMNYYDPNDKKYTQIWVDKFNTVTVFKEVESRKGYLKMQADNGKGILTVMDYSLDSTSGNVTQTMESSNDEGKTWKQSFVGIYKKSRR